MLLIFFDLSPILTPNNQSFVLLQTVHINQGAPTVSHCFLLFYLLLTDHIHMKLTYTIFSSDEKELGEDEGPTKGAESDSQSEELQQQVEEEREEEVVQEEVEEEEVESEQSHSTPCESESQPS